MEGIDLKNWWHYVAFIVFACCLYAVFDDPFMGSVLVWLLRWLLLALAVVAVIAIWRSWKAGGTHKWVVTGLYASVVVAAVVAALVVIPADRKCSPDEMADHYEKNKASLEELVSLARTSLGEGQSLHLEIEHGRCELWETGGLDQNTLDAVVNRLKRAKCLDIWTSFPDYCEVGYRRVGLGKFSYRIYSKPMDDAQWQAALSDPTLIPYNDTVVFEYGGGAAGPQVFPAEEKAEFLRR